MAKMRRQGRWQSFMVVNGRWDRPRVYPRDPVVDCLWGSLLVFAKTSFVFPYSRDSFWRNFKFSNDRKRPQTTIWKLGFKLGLRDAICLTGSFVFALYHCVNFGVMRCGSGSLNRLVADQSHHVILASHDVICPLRFYFHSLSRILPLWDSHSGIAWVQKNRSDGRGV